MISFKIIHVIPVTLKQRMFSTVRNCLKRNVTKKSWAFRLSSAESSKSENGKTITDNIPVFKYAINKPSDRRVYVWGLFEHGGLGLKNTKVQKNGIGCVTKPVRLDFGERYHVHNIACGYGFTAFAVNSNDKKILYGTGVNTDSQLGFNPKDDAKKNGVVIQPRPIDLPIKNSSTRVLDIGAGRAHLLVLTSEGVFTLGNNAYGQCGRPIIENESYSNSRVVHSIPDIKGKKIKAVSAGQDHSILLTEGGEVYAFGWGADGQTGLAHYHNEYRPGIVKGDLAGQRIIKVTGVCDCVLALNDKGQVFGWGNSEYHQLPITGDTHQINIATELKLSDTIGHAVDIASGGSFCMILNNVGEVYVWGYGILGLGPEVQRVMKPTLIPPVLFGKNEYEKDTKVVKIFCGMSHLAALTNKGDLYMWGRNKYGSLGLGDYKDQYFPLKVNLGAQPLTVACGIDHSIALCRPFI